MAYSPPTSVSVDPFSGPNQETVAPATSVSPTTVPSNLDGEVLPLLDDPVPGGPHIAGPGRRNVRQDVGDLVVLSSRLGTGDDRPPGAVVVAGGRVPHGPDVGRRNRMDAVQRYATSVP